tara:strand:+ start:67 stop:684 length:618 start_codon:yes stop_codon:yes gene_type:complete
MCSYCKRINASVDAKKIEQIMEKYKGRGIWVWKLIMKRLGSLYLEGNSTYIKTYEWMDEDLKYLEGIYNEVRNAVNEELDKKLETMEYSYFGRIYGIKYGDKSEFEWHKDDLGDNEIRIIFTIKARGKCGILKYKTDLGEIQDVQNIEGKGVIIRGATTEHKVEPGEDESERWVLIFTYTEDVNKRRFCISDFLFKIERVYRQLI